VSTTWQTVHVRVNDAARGQPTPIRLRITDPEGNYFPPLGRLAEFATDRNQDVGGNLLLGMKAYAYIDGSCEVRLPAGPLVVEVNKGFEYRPLREEVVLKPGQLSLRFTLERWTDARQQGWFSGDMRAHFLTPHAALLEGAAEDLAVVNLLASECRVAGPYGKQFLAIPNILAFSGQTPALERPGHLVAVNTHNVHPVLGSLGLLYSHRIVFPLSFGGPEGWDNWTLADWCDQCHRKGGLVVWTRAWHEREEFAYGEPLADLILGKIDAFEIDFFEDSPFDVLADWYRLLGCSFRLPLAGASGKDCNGIALGSMRTYARLNEGQEFTYKNWIEAVRSGRTVITNGPLLSFSVNGQVPGTLIDLASPAGPVHVRAEASSVAPFDTLEIVSNGAVVASSLAAGSPTSAVIEAEIKISQSGWVGACCRGSQQIMHRPTNQRIFAHTSPVYVNVAGRPMLPEPDQLRVLIGHLDQMLAWVENKARCETDQQRLRLGGIFQNARDNLIKRGNAV
jgi:hypothetical protein